MDRLEYSLLAGVIAISLGGVVSSLDERYHASHLKASCKDTIALCMPSPVFIDPNILVIVTESYDGSIMLVVSDLCFLQYGLYYSEFRILRKRSDNSWGLELSRATYP